MLYCVVCAIQGEAAVLSIFFVCFCKKKKMYFKNFQCCIISNKLLERLDMFVLLIDLLLSLLEKKSRL